MFVRLQVLGVEISCLVVALVVCPMCGCDASVKKRVTATHGLTIEQISGLGGKGADSRGVSWSAAERYRDPPRVPAAATDENGNPITVSCASCHGNLPANAARCSASDLREFHAGLRYDHGGYQPLTCLTCHRPENYNQLRLADGRALEFWQSRALCAQCHAKENRDYEHGAHGGMTGHWDLNRGAVERKTCIDCHDPHAPAIPAMSPGFKPLDRFLSDGARGQLGAAHE